MKKDLLFFILLIIAARVSSQPGVKIRGYEQENFPGTVPSGIKDENGNPQKKAAAEKNYYIFLSFNKKFNITPSGIFIKGRSFAIETTYVKKTPVEFFNNNVSGHPQKMILVPETDNKVIEIVTAVAKMEAKKDPYLRKLTGSNDVVIVYLWNNKKYFGVLKRLKKMEPFFNE